MDSIVTTPGEIAKIMEFNQRIFDIVRLVEPEETQVETLKDGKLVSAHQEPCYSVWEKNSRCENCISRRACNEGKRITKLEFRGSEVYSVVSIPVVLVQEDGKKKAALEMVNKVTDDMYLQSSGHGRWTDQVSILSRKLYLDSLTGVFNRRYFDEHVFLYDPTSMLSLPTGFMMIDINNFKLVNDRFGHSVGDQALISTAHVLRDSVRKQDAVLRYGGDEFVLIFRDCNNTFLNEKVAELKRKVAELTFEEAPQLHITISIGCSYTGSIDGSEWQIASLMNDADAEMYHDKESAG
ncbi:MAG: GGDEF domain-containing protein [Solobacterium sp.]|jgi:putative two-component system response regulator|nr:GGDEF domain-containing protein [Solobacterium sp.]MCH4223284.1 GGDEF domain-containing protein [Solobacterium sp.]MCH4266614.1 GGDEF domain-containing protein [Solobacterium sp.]